MTTLDYVCIGSLWINIVQLKHILWSTNIHDICIYMDMYYKLTSCPTPGMNPGIVCHEIKANLAMYLKSKYECFLTSGCQEMDL